MTTNNWSKAGMIFAVIFTLTSLTRYWIFYTDPDRAIAYTILGIVVFACAWLYNKVKNLENNLDYVETYIQDKLGEKK